MTLHASFLLAAGLGTRLRPLTLRRPKPMLPLCGVPMLEYSLALLARHGLAPPLVNAHHLWPQVARWAESRGAGLQVELPEILGTGGGLRAGLARLADPVVIVNGDVLCDVDLAALRAACPPGGAAMAARQAPELGGMTPLVLAGEAVIRIGDVTAVPGAPPASARGPGVHFTGIHALSHAAIERVPPDRFACIVQTAYRELVPEGLVVGRFHAGLWLDVGTPAGYLQANLDALAGRLPLPLDPWTRGQRGPGGSWVGEGARVEGQVRRCVIGAGAVVPAGADLEDCVVWDGCEAPRETLSRAIVYDGGVLAEGSIAVKT